MTPRRLSDVPPQLALGHLVLDTVSHTVSGPSGTRTLRGGPYILLRELLRQPDAPVSRHALIAALWPDPNTEPPDADHGVRLRVARVRSVLEEIGIAPGRIRCSRGEGYAIEGEPRVVRSFSPAAADLLDRIVRTHPDTALVGAFLSGRDISITIGAAAGSCP